MCLYMPRRVHSCTACQEAHLACSLQFDEDLSPGRVCKRCQRRGLVCERATSLPRTPPPLPVIPVVLAQPPSPSLRITAPVPSPAPAPVAPTLVAGQLQRSWQWWGAADAPAFRAGDRSSGSSPNGLPSRGDETDSSTTPPHPEPALEQPAQTQTQTQASHHGLFDPIEVAAHSSTATHSMEPVVLSMGPSESVLRGGEPPAADLLRKAPIVGGCWGAHLSGRPCLQDWDLRQQFSSSGIFVRFCASCQHHGVLVPWERLRMLPEGSRLANSASNGAPASHPARTVPPHRAHSVPTRAQAHGRT